MSERVTHIGNYRIERELAQEERRTVYQGWQMSLNRPVQITQLTSEAAADGDFLTRWKLVARDLRDPGHPQVPRILDAQFSGEHPYLVESYLVADTLADQLTAGQDLNASLRLVAGIADALGYAHKRGWAYGQLGPDSVRVRVWVGASGRGPSWAWAVPRRPIEVTKPTTRLKIIRCVCLAMILTTPPGTSIAWTGRCGRPGRGWTPARTRSPPVLRPATSRSRRR